MQRLSLALFGILLGIFIVEILLRIVYPLETTLVWRNDNLVGRRLVANQSGIFVAYSKEYSTPIGVNSEGWRDSEHELDKPENTYRILIIGDSFVENFQVPLEKTIFKQLEKNLKVEVVAMGLGDSGTAQQYLILKEYGLAYKPNLVLHLFFTGNDVKNNSLDLMGDPHRPYFKLTSGTLELQKFHFPPTSFIDPTKKFLKNNLRVVELLLNKKGELVANNNSVDYQVYDTNYSPAYLQAWEITKALILASREVVEESEAEYILVSLANNEQVHQHPDLSSVDLEKPDKILSEFCDFNQLNCRFMLPYFREYIKSNPNSATHFPQDGHWNETGTDLASKFLTNTLSSFINGKD